VAGPLVAVVGFGANLGDRLGTMRAAAAELARDAHVVRTSRVFATAPVGLAAQPEFFNAAALAEYAGGAEELLDVLLAIEAKLGRVRAGATRWGPRTIDLDILWAQGTRLRTARLEVPHPRLRERAFAVIPLLDVVPGAVDPETGTTYGIPPGDVRATDEVLWAP
jgi:2-amino-4-hydroxy-6-hydroxymethyldihydropteridine diphosphokinase